MKKVGVLEDICPFCGEPNGEASIILADTKITEGKKKAIGNPCPHCAGLLDHGEVGFLSPQGEGIILSYMTAKDIMQNLGVLQYFKIGKRNVVKVSQKFWDRQFRKIVKAYLESR